MYSAISGVWLSIIAAPVNSAESADGLTEAEFQQCLVRLQSAASSAVIDSEDTLIVLANARFLDNVIVYDRRQPEFVQTFPNYLNKRVNDWRINKGRAMLAKHRPLLNELSRVYGVPPHYIMAFWGLETNFGAYKGKMPIIDSLVTLACDQRRSDFFTKELLQALRLLEREQLSPELMVGSWAGAMGHTQFMPSAYLRYALDGDDDGKIDLWESEPDAFRSAANFLNQLGWQRGYRWGREVGLRDGFDYTLAGRNTEMSLAEWAQAGVTKADGADLPAIELQASLLVPAGHEGPAFLVYKNFDVIMRWNNSESYALAVGLLADQIVGEPGLIAALPQHPNFTVESMRQLQQALTQMGIDVGEPDGIYGPATRAGIQTFQRQHNEVADGYPSPEVMEKITNSSENHSNNPSDQ